MRRVLILGDSLVFGWGVPYEATFAGRLTQRIKAHHASWECIAAGVGSWNTRTEMEFLRAAIDQSQQGVTGEARIRLYKGSATVTGRRSPVSLYDEALSTFEDSDARYDQADASGFIRVQGLRLSGRPGRARS